MVDISCSAVGLIYDPLLAPLCKVKLWVPPFPWHALKSWSRLPWIRQYCFRLSPRVLATLGHLNVNNFCHWCDQSWKGVIHWFPITCKHHDICLSRSNLSVSLYTYVCVCVCLRVRVHVCVYEGACVCVRACVRACMRVSALCWHAGSAAAEDVPLPSRPRRLLHRPRPGQGRARRHHRPWYLLYSPDLRSLLACVSSLNELSANMNTKISLQGAGDNVTTRVVCEYVRPPSWQLYPA